VGELVDPADLVGAHEIAERLDVSRSQVVHVWRKRHADFPEPIATLRSALIWDWTHVEAWAQATGRLQ
jgi:predicted DNA-binding transcriptional regulator AlpA